MRIGHIVPLIAKRYTNPATRNRALFLKGKSGIGKSQTIKQASDLLAQHIPNWQGVIDLRLSQMEPTDLRGIPVEKDGKTHWLAPSFLPEPDTAGFILFDEDSVFHHRLRTVSAGLARLCEVAGPGFEPGTP